MELSAITDSGRDDKVEDGFRVSMSGASLPEFVQMECLAQSNRVFRIISGNRIGYLFFEHGQIVHAMTADESGENAAVEILKWRDGSVDACNLEWPDPPTIKVNYQALLLRAAQSRDESGRHKVGSVSSDHTPTSPTIPASSPPTSYPPASSPPVSSSPATDPPTASERPPKPRKQVEPTMNAPPVSQSQSLSLSNLEAFVRLDANGTVLNAKGAAEDLAPIAAYAARLADLVGDLLGMEAILSLECVFAGSRVLVNRERTGNLVALRATTEVDLSGLRERFGL